MLQAMARHPDAVRQFACGDPDSFATLKDAAVRFAGGEFDEAEIVEALNRKLREGL